MLIITMAINRQGEKSGPVVPPHAILKRRGQTGGRRYGDVKVGRGCEPVWQEGSLSGRWGEAVPNGDIVGGVGDKPEEGMEVEQSWKRGGKWHFLSSTECLKP